MEHCTPLKTAYDIYHLNLQSRRRTQSTLDFFRWRLTPFLSWCEKQNDLHVQEITATHIRGYLVSLQERNLADYSQLAATRAIRAFCRFCEHEGMLEKSPSANVRMTDNDDRILPAFTELDVRKLLAEAQCERDKAIILVLLDTGLRAFELLALNGEDVDLETGSVSVQKGAGKKVRTVYVGARTRRQLHRYFLSRGIPRKDEPVFPL